MPRDRKRSHDHAMADAPRAEQARRQEMPLNRWAQRFS
jgi:hypothetical protein